MPNTNNSTPPLPQGETKNATEQYLRYLADRVNVLAQAQKDNVLDDWSEQGL